VVLERSWVGLGPVLARSWAILVVVMGLKKLHFEMQLFGVVLGSSWALLGPAWGRPGRAWPGLAAILGGLGWSWSSLGPLLGYLLSRGMFRGMFFEFSIHGFYIRVKRAYIALYSSLTRPA